MKSYLLYFLVIFPFGILNSQVEGKTTNNSNTIAIPVEKREKPTSFNSNIEAEESIEQIPDTLQRTPSQPSSPLFETAAMPEMTIDSQKANYITNYTNFSQQRAQRSLTDEQKVTMDDLLRRLAASQPQSFESYLFYYLNGQNDLNRSKALLKAKEMKPTDGMVQKEMMTYYVLMNKKDDTRKALLDLTQNKVYPASTASYGEDMINSAPQNATLITHGKEDSYAALYAQKVKREREDVEIISLDWLTSPQYRINLKAQGWNLPVGDFIDTKYLAELCALNPQKSIAISMTLPKEYLLPILDKLYVSGVVFEYKEVPTDMTVRNEELWDKELNKELIKKKDNDLVSNYLPMLFQLKRVYESRGDSEAVNKLDEIIKDITTR
jgi:hypothetical protein